MHEIKVGTKYFHSIETSPDRGQDEIYTKLNGISTPMICGDLKPFPEVRLRAVIKRYGLRHEYSNDLVKGNFDGIVRYSFDLSSFKIVCQRLRVPLYPMRQVQKLIQYYILLLVKGHSRTSSWK